MLREGTDNGISRWQICPSGERRSIKKSRDTFKAPRCSPSECELEVRSLPPSLDLFDIE